MLGTLLTAAKMNLTLTTIGAVRDWRCRVVLQQRERCRMAR